MLWYFMDCIGFSALFFPPSPLNEPLLPPQRSQTLAGSTYILWRGKRWYSGRIIIKCILSRDKEKLMVRCRLCDCACNKCNYCILTSPELARDLTSSKNSLVWNGEGLLRKEGKSDSFDIWGWRTAGCCCSASTLCFNPWINVKSFSVELQNQRNFLI